MMPVRFSTSRNSKPPASLVMDPPSNCPRTSRCFRGLNGNGSWLHSVVIRLSPFVGVTATLNIFYATKRQPLLFFNEKCGLAAALNDAAAPPLVKTSTTPGFSLHPNVDVHLRVVGIGCALIVQFKVRAVRSLAVRRRLVVGPNLLPGFDNNFGYRPAI